MEHLEIEGQKTDIKKLVPQIGLDWHKRILLNYLSIFDILKKKLNLPFSDVTFDNFKNVRFNLAEYLDLFEVNRI